MKVQFYYEYRDYAEFCGAKSESYIAYPEELGDEPKVGDILYSRYGESEVATKVEDITHFLVSGQGEHINSFDYYRVTYSNYENGTWNTLGDLVEEDSTKIIAVPRPEPEELEEEE